MKVDSQLSNNDGGSQLEGSSWIVGLYKRFSRDDSAVSLETYADEHISRTVYKQNSNQSRVLWRLLKKQQSTNPSERKLVACCTATWDKEGLGVATLLFQNEHGSTNQNEAAKTIVRAAMERGMLPSVPPDRSQATQVTLKLATSALFARSTVSYFGAAPLRHTSLCYFENLRRRQQQGSCVKRVALTIDDAPCRFHDAAASSELPRVRRLLQHYNAKATFMIVGSWCCSNSCIKQDVTLTTPHYEDLVSLLQDGHEFGNHCMTDRSYEFDENFGTAVDECSKVICDLQTAAGCKDVGVRWFRAPHGRYTQSMEDALKERNLTNVMCDTYASCPVIQDGDFIAEHLARTCRDGSIILLHMPERHVRTWCLTALEGLLKKLQEQGVQVTTLGEMSALNEANS